MRYDMKQVMKIVGYLGVMLAVVMAQAAYGVKEPEFGQVTIISTLVAI